MKRIGLFLLLLMNTIVIHAITYDYDTITVNTIEGVPMSILVSKIIMNGNQPVTVRKNSIPTSTSGTVTVPSEVTNKGRVYTVNGVQADAFKDCSLVTKVNLPETITSLGNAFKGCTSLTHIDIPDGITELFGTFQDCTSIQTVSIGNSVKKILYAFTGCTSLKSIEIPNSVEIISDAFGGCTSLESIAFGTGVKTVGGFDECINLKKITLPESVTTIGSFKGCIGLTEFIIPNSVTKISGNAFYGCIGLSSLTIPSSVTEIGLNAFNGCKIKKLIFENGSTTINLRFNSELNKGLFVSSDNPELEELYIGRNMSVLSGDKDPFDGLTSLKIIEYGNPSISIEKEKFSGNTNLTTAKLACGAIGERAFSSCTNLTTVIFNDGLTNIGKEAFFNCVNLDKIEIPNSTTYIGQYAFYNCSGLTSVKIGNSVQKIDHYAFYDCTNLSSLILGENLNSIGMNSFYNCKSLKEVVIPESATFMYAGAFSYCTSLTNVKILGKVKGVGGFSGCTSLQTVEMVEGIEEIYSSAFRNTSITSVTIPSTVTIINEYAFSGCKNLSDIILPQNLKTIGNYAFSDCPISSISLPPNITKFKDYAFYNCSSLRTVISNIHNPYNISSNVFNNIPSDAILYVPYGLLSKYSDKTGWKDFKSIVENGVKKGDIITANITNGGYSIGGTFLVTKTAPIEVQIGAGDVAFTGDMEGKLSIPSYASGYDSKIFTIVGIGAKAFSGKKISNLTLPVTIENIDDAAFENCSTLQSVSVGWRHPASICIKPNCFNGISTDAILYVPAGTKGRYEEIEAWQKFSQIVEVSPISIGDVATGFGSQTNLPIILNSAEVISGIQCKLTLPKGVSLVEEDGEPIASLTNRAEGFTVMGHKDPDAENSYLFVMFSLDGNSITGNEGAIMNVKLNVSSDVEPDKYDMIIEDITLATSTFNTLYPAAASSELLIDESIVKTIDFVDAEVKSICIANWDVNNDGELDMDEAASVSNLNNAFKGNTSITSFDELQYFTGLTSIPASAFNGCNKLLTITIPNNVTYIGDKAFSTCESLTSVIIPNSVTSIGNWIFDYCSGLTSVTIGSSVESIGIGIFNNCSSLTSVKVEGCNLHYDSRDDCNAIIETSSNTLIRGCKGTIIPNSVTTIGKNAFEHNSGFSSITIPNSVTSIGYSAFHCCSDLTSITIPNSVTSIGYDAFDGTAWYDNQPDGLVYAGEFAYKYKGEMPANTQITLKDGTLSIVGAAFENCIGLTSITIPNSLTSIGDYAFCDCSALTSVTIPNSVTSIGNGAFYDCSGLTSVTLEAKTPITISDNVFTNRANATLYVPAGSKAAYEVTDYWKEFKEIIEKEANKVKLSRTKAIMPVGKTGTLKATVYPTTLEDKSVTWKSSNKKVATVTSTGKVTAVGVGTAKITCTSVATGAKATCKVTVGKVDLSKSEATVPVGKSGTLKATVYPTTLEDKSVTWKSSNKKVATVSTAGKVKAVGVGTAIITCTSNATGLKATCTLTVGQVVLSKTEAIVAVGKSGTLKATVYPETLADKSVTWKSSDTEVATVTSAGKVKAVGVGTAIITCTSKATGLSATCTLTVGKVVLSKSKATVTVGKSGTLKATVYPETLEDKSVTWKSSDKKVATVSSAGRVKAVGVGTAKITCTSVATGLSATCTVTVTASVGTRSLDGDDDDATGIDEVTVVVEPFDVYDLSGRKVRHQVTSLDGLPNGIYIVNGRKVIKKD